MDIAMLVIGIMLAIAGIVGLVYGPNRTITTVVNTVEHEYKMSKDYGRLYDMLVEGREIIVIRDTGYPSKACTADWELPSGKITKRFYGFNLDHCLDGCTRDKFILYCQLHDIKYLDQIDKYLLMEDYMKK